jgi:rhodanese-related sulfurtransferase
MESGLDAADRTFWALVLVLGAVVALKYLPRYQARVPFVDAAELKRRLDAGDDVVIIDVRTAGEFGGKRGRIPGAINVSVGDLKVCLLQRAGDIEAFRGHPVYVYDLGERRAAVAARALHDAKFSRVSVVKGGLKAWLRRGFPVEHG